MTSQALLAEAPYGVDENWQALYVKYKVAARQTREGRQSELARRLLGAAEAARWPAHSLALARLRFQLAHALEQIDRLPTEEEDMLLEAARDTVLARLDAGTLLTLTPSERAFEDACDAAARRAAGGDGGASARQHTLGYATALSVAVMLFRRTVFAWAAANDCSDSVLVLCFAARVDRNVSDVARLLALVRAVRCAPPDTCNAERQLVMSDHEMVGADAEVLAALQSLVRFCERHAWFPRTMAITRQHDHVARLREAWRDAADAYGPRLFEVVNNCVPVAAAMDKAQHDALHQRYPLRACAHCGANEPEPRLFKVCSRCAGTAYCCKEHQVAHWRAGHKAECKKRCAQGGAAAE